MKNIHMNLISCTLLLASCIAFCEVANAQPPNRGVGGERGPGGPGGPGPGPGGPGRPGGRPASNAATTLDAFVAKWLTMDTNADGQLTLVELKDERLTHLFKSSDKNADGILSKEEMKLLFESSNASGRPNRGGPGRPGRPGEDRARSESRQDFRRLTFFETLDAFRYPKI